MSNSNGKRGMFQPIWKAAPGRRNAAIVAWIGMVVITLAAFFPAYGKSGNAITDAMLSAINMLAGTNLSTSFTLFAACRTNIVLLILFEIALALGFLFPLLTETELELIPVAILAGIHIYVCVNAAAIAGDSSVSILTPGFILSLVGLAVLVIGIVLHFLSASKGKAEKVPGTYTGVTQSDDIYSGDPDEETNILDDGPAATWEDEDTTATVVMHHNDPVGTLKRMNTGEILAVYEGESIIGRNAGKAQLVVNSAAVSGVHARISAFRGGCTVTDLSSTNGTYVNGNRIAPNSPTELREGDYLSLGAEILEFHLK